jgi:ribosomal protein S18 acetylase RimI-like enzyme
VGGSINTSDVGHRVVLRRLIGVTDGRPQYTDVLGELRSLGGGVAVVRTKDGTEVGVPTGEIALAKRVPPAPARRPYIPDLELERIAALGWPGTESVERDGWLLRAGGGFTGRANSALPLTGDVDVAPVLRWYAERGLPALVQVPTTADLFATLTGRGWDVLHGAVVLTAIRTDVRRTLGAPRDDLPAAEVLGASPDDEWLALYHPRGGDLPPAALGVLTAGSDPEFVSLRLDGRTVAACRTATAEGWLGISAVEVHPEFRRRGLATHLLRAVVERTAAAQLYLQTEHTNAPALALYRGAGFTTHHEYRYLRAPA